MPTPLEHLDEMLADLPASRGPRMPLSTLCAAFYLIHREFPRPLIAKTFGISEATVALLANCLRADARRYARVAEEWQKLGAEAFGQRYYTQDVDDRVARIRAGAEAKKQGVDVRADKYAGAVVDLVRQDGMPVQCLIEWRTAGQDLHPGYDTPLPARWAFREISCGHEPTPADRPEARWTYERYRTSSEARKAIFYNYGVDEPS
jgi:hypothetical protein